MTIESDHFFGVDNYKAWEDEPIPLEEKNNFSKLAENLVSYALLAASTHNTQPWLWGINEGQETLSLRVNKEAILLESDRKERQSFISVGCALENLQLAASYYGFAPHIDYFPDNDRYLVEQEIQAEMQSQSEMTVHLHIFSLNPYRATVKLGKVSDNWWEEFL